jgi:predicted nucleic acid-binding protein
VFHLLWDASALAKRYVAEIGSQTVNALFMAVPPAQMVTTIMSYSETFAALLRKHNQRVLSVAAFTAAQAALRNEVIENPDFVVVGLEFDDRLDGIELIKRHTLNSTDGASLQALLKHAGAMRPTVVSVLVASDQRLLRAAKAEGVQVLNPESVQAVDIPAFLAAL